MAFVFGNQRIARIGSGRSRFGHSFGGPPDRVGTSRAECHGLHIHLLHRLDLTDSAIPVTVPGVRWLPIYYCFDFRVNDLGYRLLSDDALVSFIPTDDPSVSTEESWPGDDYPMEFPRSEVAVGPHPYDPTDLDDALAWAGIFGIGSLSAKKQVAAKCRVAEWTESLGFHPPETDEEFREAACSPFTQGWPRNTCLNPACDNRTRPGSLAPVALVPSEPVPRVHLFGQWGGGVILIVEKCPLCHTFRVSNQSG